MFFQSLLPNFNVQQGGFPAANAQANAANQGMLVAAAAGGAPIEANLQLDDGADG